MRKLAELAIERPDRVEPAVEQGVGNPGLLLHAGGERHVGVVDGADVEDQIGLELEQNFEICRVAAAGQPTNLGLVAPARAQKFALLGIMAAGPTDEEIGRKRVEENRRRRPGCEDTFNLFRNRKRATTRIGDGRACKARREDRGRRAAQERSAMQQHQSTATMTSLALMTA